MTIDSAKDLQMNIAKEGLALLMFHPSFNVQPHRECIFLIGTAWDIPVGDTQEVTSLLDHELSHEQNSKRVVIAMVSGHG